MKASGNGTVKTCAENLLRITRGEVPYERVKGLDPRHIDRPTTAALPDVRQDARWLLETYEPRAAVERITAALIEGAEGGLQITAAITGEGEVTSGGQL